MEGLESTLVFDITMILQVVLIDLALGGDNSIVIGMAAKNLPKHLQKRAILYGTAGAICMRFIMAFIVSWLFQIPFLKTVGAILLVLIGLAYAVVYYFLFRFLIVRFGFTTPGREDDDADAFKDAQAAIAKRSGRAGASDAHDAGAERGGRKSAESPEGAGR